MCFVFQEDSTNWITYANLIAASVSALATLGLAFIGYIQLQKIAKSGVLDTVLKLESELSARKQKLSAIAAQISFESSKSDPNHNKINILIPYIDTALENYLNALDRLSFCILNQYIPDREWKTEYKKIIISAVTQNEPKFSIDTSYNNIAKLYKKWANDA
jgi:hypothetical protein